MQRIFFTWPAKTVFVPKKWPSAYQVIMCKINSPRGLRRDIPWYYSLFPNRLVYPFVDQLRLQYVITPIPFRWLLKDLLYRSGSATRKSQNTPSKCMKLKNNHSKHCSIERAFNSKLPADDSISPFKPGTTDVHVIPGLMLIMLYLSRQIFWWFTALLPKSADHIDERHLARLPLASLLSFLSNRSYTCQLAKRHLMLYGFSIFPNSERGQTWKQPNVKACSLRTVWEVYGYSMVFIENQ